MSVASAFGAPVSFYSRPGHELVKCPDCGHNADALFGDHGGTCLDDIAVVSPRSALGIIYRYAKAHPRGEFSMNHLRAAFDQLGVPGESRGPAFTAARKRRYIEPVGHEPSTDPATKRHDVKKWRSTFPTSDELARAKAAGE